MSLLGFVFDQIVNNQGIFVSILLLVVFIFVLSKFFWSPKPGPNPFARDCVRPPKSVVIDQTARDKVLRQGFQPKLVPSDLDAVVIGSGIGGLTSAAILAKSGQKVLVLEQHDQAGGCCHTFINKGFEFDVGIHYIGEMRRRTTTKLLIDQITEGQLEWCDLIDEFDVVALGEPGKQKLFPFRAGGYEVYKKALMENFPREEAAIDKYIALLKEVRRNMMGMMMVKVMPKWIVKLLIATGLINVLTKFFKLSRRTLKSVLDELTDDKDLKTVLAYSWGDYGVPPTDSSFAMHAMLINHYMYGASYPRGGASEIAFHIIPVIEKSGGRVLVRAPVSEILIDDSGKAVGVRVNRSSGPVDIHARVVISDAGVLNTFTKLLPLQIANKTDIYGLLERSVVGPSVGCMSVFVGLNGTAEELGIKPQNIWSYTSNDLSETYKKMMTLSADDLINSDLPMLFISFPGAKDPTFNDKFPGKSVCTIVTFANWEWFKQWQNERVNNRGADYEAVKMSIARRMWQHVTDIYPQLADKEEHFEVGSPVTNNYYIASTRGETYGLDHNVRRFGDPEVLMKLRPETDIPGLMLTGQDALSCGFSASMFSGLLCASSILHRNLYNDLVNLRKQLRKAQ